MSAIDDLFAAAAGGDREAFAEWMGRAERPVRSGLARFARAVDVEGVVQETFLRMWIFARERAGSLQGEDASLRFAIGMARNIARNEARRIGRIRYLPPEDLPLPAVEPAPPADDALARLIRECLGALAARPRDALTARLRLGAVRSDRQIAEELGMTRNTFLQNVVRARQQMRDCLRRRGVAAEELDA